MVDTVYPVSRCSARQDVDVERLAQIGLGCAWVLDFETY